MNIREALPTFLATRAAVTGLVGAKIFPVIRPQGITGTSLVFRVVKGEDGAALDGDTHERVYTLELVAWAPNYPQAVAIGDVLKTLFHGTGNYAMGELQIDESYKTGEYDGDRVTDMYADCGDYPITFVFEFHWIDA